MLWFSINNHGSCCEIPIYIRKLGLLRFGWTPYGIPYRGNSDIVRKSLQNFLRKNRLLGLLSYSFEHLDKNNLIKSYGFSTHLRRSYTYILDLTSSDGLELHHHFNNTTKKHIRRAIRAGYEIKPMLESDIDNFFVQYQLLCSNNQFSPVCTNNFLLNLFHLCQEHPDSGMTFCGLKSVRNGQTHGYLIGLSNGGYFFEFLRADVASLKHNGYDRKLLTWEMLKAAISRKDRFYDFGGVDPTDGRGIMDFKRGFGGKLCRSSSLKLLLSL